MKRKGLYFTSQGSNSIYGMLLAAVTRPLALNQVAALEERYRIGQLTTGPPTNTFIWLARDIKGHTGFRRSTDVDRNRVLLCVRAFKQINPLGGLLHNIPALATSQWRVNHKVSLGSDFVNYRGSFYNSYMHHRGELGWGATMSSRVDYRTPNPRIARLGTFLDLRESRHNYGGS